jgi:hypothetical protein
MRKAVQFRLAGSAARFESENGTAGFLGKWHNADIPFPSARGLGGAAESADTGRVCSQLDAAYHCGHEPTSISP